MCAGQGKDPCPGYVAHVGVLRRADIIVDNLEEMKTLGLQVGGGHAGEGLAGGCSGGGRHREPSCCASGPSCYPVIQKERAS